MHTTNDFQSLRLTSSKNHILEEGDPPLLDDPRRESMNRDLQVLNRHYESMNTL